MVAKEEKRNNEGKLIAEESGKIRGLDPEHPLQIYAKRMKQLWEQQLSEEEIHSNAIRVAKELGLDLFSNST